MRTAELLEKNQISTHQCLLLLPGPFLELGLAPARCAEVGAGFQPQQLYGRIVPSRMTRRAPKMIFHPLLQINRAPDVDIAGAKAEEIDKRHAPRRIRDDLTRGFNQEILGHGSALAAEHGTPNASSNG